MKKLNRSWIKYIDPNSVDIYPLQFANCDRLQKYDNHVVYIFDEVGCGKTISSGLMAIDFLMNNPDSTVLIITTKALVNKRKNSEYGQFLTDWYDKLPFKKLNLTNQISIVNNHPANLKEKEYGYGLVIIDEAHLFLNVETKRYKNLIKNIRANKVVFLTATPIKETPDDLTRYTTIANTIANKNGTGGSSQLETDNSLIKMICTEGKDSTQIICNTFDIKSPVTRYFKDTMICLNTNKFEDTNGRGLHPHIWEYENCFEKNKVLFAKIEKILENTNEPNRFVIFTRYVDKEAKKIGSFFNTEKYEMFQIDKNNPHPKTYYVVTGENAYELSQFSKKSNNLPTVLILTYQISEQGVNLPSYNYVINYHVSSYPSVLEQRFGRIDRMGSGFRNINMSYMISKKRWDSNTVNFHIAVATYLNNLISYIPSKNTLLTKEILAEYNSKIRDMTKNIDKIKELYKVQGKIDEVLKFYLENQEGINEDGENELLDFLIDRDIDHNIDKNEKNYKEKFIKIIEKEIEDVIVTLSINGQSSINDILASQQYEKLLDPNDLSSKIIYKVEPPQNIQNPSSLIEKRLAIGTMDALECGKQISNNPAYSDYYTTFKDTIKIPLLLKKIPEGFRQEVNTYFESCFMNNQLELIFPTDGYSSIIKNKFIESKLINEWNFDESERALFLSEEVCKIFVDTLPFFKMCADFKDIIQGRGVGNYSREWETYYYINPFTQTLFRLKKAIENYGLSSKFYNAYWNDDNQHDYHKRFYIMRNDRGFVQASNWYRLAFHYTKNVLVVINKNKYCEKNDRFNNLNDWFNNLVRQKKITDENKLKPDYLTSDTDIKFEQRYDYIQNEIHFYQSERINNRRTLFYEFIFREQSGDIREYVNANKNLVELCNKNLDILYLPPTESVKVSATDIWTIGILETFNKNSKRTYSQKIAQVQ